MAPSDSTLKYLPQETTGEAEVGEQLGDKLKSTFQDVKDMKRMGKTQELRRTFRYFSTLFFVCVLTATWEFLLIANTNGLVDGGRPGLLWTLVWCIIGMGLIIASLAEMSSMSPTSGGQYHWISEFAPAQHQQALSYAAGWLSTLSWQAATASSGTLMGGIIQGLIFVNNPDYAGPAWHLFLLAVATMVAINLFNIYGTSLLTPIQTPLMLLHVSTLVVVIAVFWSMGPTVTAHEVFLDTENLGGWSSTGLAFCVGQISALFGLMCNDAGAHMSEEVQDAATAVPRSMFWSYAINSILGLILVISYLFAMPSVDDAVNDPSGFPFLYVFQQAMPISGTNALTTIILFLLFWSNVMFNASTARQTWSFARDRGLPFSSWLSKVDKRRLIPANAIWFSLILSILLNLIILGSSAAFNALMSLQLVALMASYMISISCVLWRRITHPETLPPCRWSLGKWGVLVNCLAILFSCFAFFFCFWPMATPVDLEDMNWSAVMFVGVMVISMIMFLLEGRKVYAGPVTKVELFTDGLHHDDFGNSAR